MIILRDETDNRLLAIAQYLEGLDNPSDAAYLREVVKTLQEAEGALLYLIDGGKIHEGTPTRVNTVGNLRIELGRYARGK